MATAVLSAPTTRFISHRRLRVHVTVVPWDTQARRAATLAAAQQAVRDYRDDARLAANPLAQGPTPHARATHVRGLVDDAVALAFGISAADADLREVVVGGYLFATAPHERVADELFLSRSTYFRRLSRGLDRVAGQLAEAQAATIVPARELVAA